MIRFGHSALLSRWCPTSSLVSFKTFLVLFLFVALPTCVVAFQCYVCESKTDPECVENLDPSTRLVPQECHNITGAKYCIKTTNLFAGELGTKRFCSANDQGSYCNYIRQPTGDREYRSCVLTCSSENCNSAKSFFDNSSVLYVIMSTILIGYLLLRTLAENSIP